MEQVVEIVSGERLVEMLNGLIGSRRVCKMEIPNTSFGWITMLLGFQQTESSYYLLIDKVKGFEKALSRFPNQEVSLEFLEMGGIPCQFKTRIIELHPEALWAEMPKSIYRKQKRKFVRLRAKLGAEIVFHLGQEEERAKVQDYSLGGVTFLMKRPLKIDVDSELTEMDLRIPQGDRWISFHIPQAVVRRVEKDSTGRDFCALEFLEMAETTKERLWRHIFEEQRALLRKTKKT